MTSGKKCFITGASGYLGSRIAARMETSGWEVVELGRASSGCGRSWIKWSLGEDLPQNLVLRDGVLIHCAWDLQLQDESQIKIKNIDGSVTLMSQAKNAGVRKIIFISSMSAFLGTQSKYGRSKLQVEKQLEALAGIVIRPGLVYGDPPSGLVRSLSNLASKLPIVPLIGNGQQEFYLCHEDDLSSLVEKVADSDHTPSLITAAQPRPISFLDLLKSMAEKRGKNPVFLPIPAGFIMWVLKRLEALGISAPFKSDNLVGMIHSQKNPDFKSVDEIGFKFREYDLR